MQGQKNTESEKWLGFDNVDFSSEKNTRSSF